MLAAEAAADLEMAAETTPSTTAALGDNLSFRALIGADWGLGFLTHLATAWLARATSSLRICDSTISL